jgi:hypothetical protein
MKGNFRIMVKKGNKIENISLNLKMPKIQRGKHFSQMFQLRDISSHRKIHDINVCHSLKNSEVDGIWYWVLAYNNNNISNNNNKDNNNNIDNNNDEDDGDDDDGIIIIIAPCFVFFFYFFGSNFHSVLF